MHEKDTIPRRSSTYTPDGTSPGNGSCVVERSLRAQRVVAVIFSLYPGLGQLFPLTAIRLRSHVFGIEGTDQHAF